MTVYVDDMRRPARPAGYRGRGIPKWSHLMADTTTELLAFAQHLGLNPAWIQHPGRPAEHFDVTDTVRTKALSLGATPIAYGRPGGLLSMLKRARALGDVEKAEELAVRFAHEIRAAHQLSNNPESE